MLLNIVVPSHCVQEDEEVLTWSSANSSKYSCGQISGLTDRDCPTCSLTTQESAKLEGKFPPISDANLSIFMFAFPPWTHSKTGHVSFMR
jgi:hypothetical protein